MEWKSPKIIEVAQLNYDNEIVRESVKKLLQDYKGTAAALPTLDSKAKEGPVRGSNFYFRLTLGNILRKLGADCTPLTPAQSEIALAQDLLTGLTSTYEDLGLSIYPNEGVNPKLWKHLREQSQGKVDLSIPYILTGLADVVIDDKFENGLRIDLSDLTQIYNVPILSQKDGSFDSNNPELTKSGFPSKLGNGSRKLYTRDNNDGVGRAYRGRYLDLNARYDDLAYSGGAGRVHVAKNFSSENK